MDFGNIHKKERSGWQAMRFGCCASKDEVDNGRELFTTNGTYDFTLFFASGFRSIFLSLCLFSALSRFFPLDKPADVSTVFSMLSVSGYLAELQLSSLALPLIWVVVSTAEQCVVPGTLMQE
jgi:hypothetical protein